MTNYEHGLLQVDLQSAHNHLKRMEALILVQADALRRAREEARGIPGPAGDKLWDAGLEALIQNDRLHTTSLLLRGALEGMSRTAESAQDVLEEGAVQ